MRNKRPGLVAAAAFYVLSGMCVQVRASDQGIAGKKLLMKAGKVVLISKDPTISVTGSDPVSGADSSVRFDNGGGEVSFSLPKPLWTADGTSTLFKYKNSSAPAGPSPAKIARLKSGLLKVVAKGLPFVVPNGTSTINVVLTLDGGTNSYCMSFTGTGDGSKFLVKDSAAGSCAPTSGPACCEAGAICGGADAGLCGYLFIGSTPVGGGAVCDASGNCVSGPGTPGGCCQIYSPTTACGMPSNPTDCATVGGLYASNAICNPDGTCSPACGNNTREGTEACDGVDDTACPNDCLPDCTCARCPASGGDYTACYAWGTEVGSCISCSLTDTSMAAACDEAVFGRCSVPSLNDTCGAAVNAAGCAAECCP